MPTDSIGGFLALAMAVGWMGCTDPPPEIAADWRWEPPVPAYVGPIKRLDDGGAIMALAGDAWSIVRLSDTGQEVWSFELPWIDVSPSPRVDVSGNDTFVVSYMTSEETCRVLRLDGDGQEIEAFDHGFACYSLVSVPDGGAVIGIRGSAREEGPEAVIVAADGTAQADVAIGNCKHARPYFAEDDGVFFAGYAYDCDEGGEVILETRRPWNGLFDGGALVWERESDEVEGSVIMPSTQALLADRLLTIDAAEDGHASIHAFDRGNGQEMWIDAGGGFTGIDSIDEDSVVVLWVWVDSYRLREYSADGEMISQWSIPLELTSVQRLAAAPDGSVWVAIGDPATTYAIVRYQLP